MFEGQMKKLVPLLMVAMFCGCSAIATSPALPIDVPQCRIEYPIIDALVGVAIITVVSTVSGTGAVSDDPQANAVILGTGLMYGVSHLMSSIEGWAQYGECKGALPLYPENQ
jgi:hypothetical protein